MLVAERGTAPFRWFALRAVLGRMETQEFIVSVSCKRNSHISEYLYSIWPIILFQHSPSHYLIFPLRFFWKTFPIYRWPFSVFFPSQISLQCFHTIYKEETSVAFSSPHSLLRLPHRRWKAPLRQEIWNSNQVFGFLLDDLIFPIAMVLGGFHIMAYFCQRKVICSMLVRGGGSLHN